MITTIFIVSLIGLAISLYAYIVEGKMKANPHYKPACDISDHISCSKPMLSKYSNIFYFSNAFMSIAYYLLVIALAYLNQINLIFVAALAACLISLGLAYILYFKIKSFCLVCTSLYIINFALLGLSYQMLCA